jgi:hypothetical protein
VTLGAIGYIPNMASNSGLPVGSLFLRRMFEDGWFRAQISGALNEVDLVKSFGTFELLWSGLISAMMKRKYLSQKYCPYAN